MSEADIERDHAAVVPAAPLARAPVAAAHARAATPVGGDHPLLALQRAIGNQAVQRHLRAGALPPDILLGQRRALGNQAVQRASRARMGSATPSAATPDAVAARAADGVTPLAQRSAVVGLPGANNPKVTYAVDPADTAQLAADAANALPGPAWLAGWLQPHLQALVQAPIAYTFDTVTDIVRWILVRELMVNIGNYTGGANPANARTDRGKRLRANLQLIRPLQQAYDQAGQANQAFNFCGRAYNLQTGGPGHHYASRNGKTIYYAEDFTRGDARKVLDHLRDNGRDANYAGSDKHVDNFVCAFLAEPTRWPVEQIFNLLAIEMGDDQDKIVGEATTALPMAGGSTWEPGLQGAAGAIAHGLPRRALQFASSMGWFDLITQELGGSAGFPQFALAFRQQLDITV